MSGFAVLMDTSAPAQVRDSDFESFLQFTADYKRLEPPAERVSERYCQAAKLDTSSSLHKGVVKREEKVWADLTAGFDTRLVTTMMSNVQVPFIANCVGPDTSLDVVISKIICEEAGWEYRNISLPDDWAQEQCRWFDMALQKGDAHLNMVQLSRVLWTHHIKSPLSNVTVVGLGGEQWRGAYWRQELAKIGKTTTVDYDRLMDFRMFLSPIALSVLRQDRTKQVRDELKEHFSKVVSDYADLPNTSKLDRLLVYKGTAHGGAYLSASAGLQRYLIPLYFKAPTTFSFSLNYKWKHPIFEVFFRSLLEKADPHIANIPTSSGGPAIPIRLRNVHRFWPFWKSIINRIVGKYSQKLLGKPLALRLDKSRHIEHSSLSWKQGWLGWFPRLWCS